MNKIIIDSDISYWGYGAEWLRNELKDISGDVEVEISSYGGDVFEGIAMFNMLREYDKTKGIVSTTVNSHAMSIASLLLLAGRDGYRKANKNSTIMIHKAWTWLAGNADDLVKEAQVLSGIDGILATTYGKYMGTDKESILAVMSAEGWYIGEEQINTTGFIDSYVEDDTPVNVSAKSNFKSAMARFSAEAKEREYKPNLEDTKKAILSCNGGVCNMVVDTAVPTAQMSDKPAEINQKGETMFKDSDEYKQLVASHEEQVVSAKSNYENSLREEKAKFDVFMKELPEIVAMGMSMNASKETMIAMVTAGSLVNAKVVVADSMQSKGAFGSKVDDEDKKDESSKKQEEVKARAKALGVQFIK